MSLTPEMKHQVSAPHEDFWKNKITESYARDNSVFDEQLGISAWEIILSTIDKSNISSYLDCGSNIGRNIAFLKKVLPAATSSIVELARGPYDKCLKDFQIDESFLGPLKDVKFERKFDLVFTSGVLIHVNPDDLLESMGRMFDLSSRYILIAEYFNRTPVMVSYRGEDDRLFKRDFGKLFVENFDCKVLDYGFLWGHVFDNSGFDDVTYWLFEKLGD
jgi:pseudaminic acid biosynthesis-associated methylase